MKNNIILILLTFILLIPNKTKSQNPPWYDCVPLIFLTGPYQTYYRNNYDGLNYNINRSNFSSNTYIDTAYEKIIIDPIEENLYHMSLMDYQLTIYDSLFTPSNAYTYLNRPIKRNGLKFLKVAYSKRHIDTVTETNIRMLVIRPDDTIKRPCIFFTNGAGATINTRNNIYFPVMADLALRGYCVVFYETGSSDFFLRLALNPLRNFLYPKCLVDPNHSNLPTEKKFYINFQLGYAAAKYIIKHANDKDIKADTSNFFTYGISLGGYNALALAFARNGRNFIRNDITTFEYLNPPNPVFGGDTSYNGYLKLVKKDCNDGNYNVNIKGVAAGSGALDSIYSGKFIENNIAQRKIPTILYYGSLDQTITKFDNVGATRDLKKDLNNASIPNRLVVNCTGYHPIVRTNTENDGNSIPIPIGNVNFKKDSIQTTLAFINQNNQFYNTMKYVLCQYSDLNNITCKFFSDIMYKPSNIVFPMQSSVSFIKSPLSYLQGYFYPIIPVSQCSFRTPHFETSDSCWSIFTNPSNPVLRMANKTQAPIKNQHLKDAGISLYPNPVNDNLVIHFNTNLKNDATLAVYDITGKLMTTQIIPNNTFDYTVNTTNYATGMYLVKLFNNDFSAADKFIKE